VATADEDSDGEPIDDVDAWLERNADHLRLEKARGTESWQRATSEGGEADVQKRDGTGRFRVHLPDGDPHENALVKTTDGDWAGACDCDGFRFHSKPCFHLCTLAQLDALHDTVPVDDAVAQ
jgi:hypothetical protein